MASDDKKKDPPKEPEAEKARAKPQPRGFVVELGSADDVRRAGEIGNFAGFTTKQALEAEFALFLAGKVAEFIDTHLHGLAEKRLHALRQSQAPEGRSAEVAQQSGEPFNTPGNI